MATPIGHGLAGAILGTALSTRALRTKAILAGVVVANLPDLDFIPGLLIGRPSLFHHGISHSIGAALIAALLFGFIFRRPYGFTRAATFFGLCYLSHVAIDFATQDTGREIGIPALWPVSSELHIAPLTVFGDVKRHDLTSSAVIMHNLRNVLVELVVFVPMLILLLYARRTRHEDGADT